MNIKLPTTNKLSGQSASQNFSSRLKKYFQQQHLSVQDVLSIDQLSDKDIQLIIAGAWFFKKYFVETGAKKTDILNGKSIINFFCEDSTRTRSSFELAGKHLGADTINVSASSSSMHKKGESLYDTVRTLNQLHADCIIIRDSHALTPALVASEVTAPIINAGDGWHEHPSQALLDLYTMLEEFGDVSGKTIAIIGDVLHSRVAGSLMRIAKRAKMKIRVIAPPTLIPAQLKKVFGVQVFHDMETGLKDADVIYALRIQLERAAMAYIPTVRDYSKLYCVNAERLALAKPMAIVMHAGPINREVDLTTEVMEGKQSRVEKQVLNGLAVRLALLYLLIEQAQ